YERTYSPDWYHTYREIGLPQEHWEEANARWLDYYAHEPPIAVDGAQAAVRRLQEAGVAMGLVTSGSRLRVERELRELGFAPFFAAVICHGDYEQRKPHPEALLLGLQRMGV